MTRTAEDAGAAAGHPGGPAGFGCATARRRTIVTPGLRLHALEWGTPGRPGLCLLHCGSGHAHWFDAVAGAFERDHHVIALDQRGHGESEWPVPAAYGTEAFVADVLAAARALGWRAWSLVGHSMGGHNALALAAWHPTVVRAVVAIDARPALPVERLSEMERHGRRPLRCHPSVEDAVAAFRLRPRETTAHPQLLAHVARAGIVARDGVWNYRFDPAASRLRQTADLWSLLGRVAAPTLVLRGQRSEVLGHEEAKRMVAALPDGVLVEVADAYHHVVLDQPDAVIEVVSAFLACRRTPA